MNIKIYKKHRILLSLAIVAVGSAMVMMAIFIFSAVPANAQTAGLSHKPGSLVRDNSTIFLIGKGYKQGFASLNEFLTYNYRLSRIVPANEADRQLSEGPPMRAKSGTLVLDSNDNKTVYLIGKKGEKQGLATSAAYWRYKKKSTILWKIDLNNYPVGNIIE